MGNDPDLNHRAIQSVREIIDITRNDLEHIKQIVSYGDESLMIQATALQHDLDAMHDRLMKIEAKMIANTREEQTYRDQIEKRIKAMERIVWMGVGAATLFSLLFSFFKTFVS